MKKISSIILCMALIFSMFSLVVKAEDISESLEISITSEKESYSILSDARITVTVKNIGSTILGDIHSGANSGEYKLITGTNPTATIPFLEPGQEASYSFLVTLKSNVSGLSFFQWIILTIKNFLRSTSMFPLAGINPDYTVRTTAVVKHAGIKAGVSAWAYYSDTYTLDETATKEDIVSIYNTYADKTEQDEKFFATTDSDFISAKSGDTKIQSMFDSVTPTLKNILSAETQTGITKIPGTRPLKSENVEQANAYVNTKGNKIYKIVVTDQAGNDAVSDKIQTEDVRIAINQLGYDIVSGFDTLNITNSDSTVLFTCNSSTGYITSGKWYTTHTISVENMKLSYSGIDMTIKDVNIVYSTTISF